ncbi:hypothetical protein B9479_006299 [Cryptococcus floricola]|uniref:Major facilitator superfamily (MFS) profile domain-containing protein n=1 Tax=Cryptococcus floricola TaxID=2591691 RepID=A0A5D3ANH9_9TREE|nr:hypothetical protein B9479_006299 [Cryptococcus floricola]
MSHPTQLDSHEDKKALEPETVPSLHRDDASSAEAAQEKSLGVSKVEAFNKVLYQSGRSGKLLLWSLAVSIGLTMFVYAFDQGITTTIFSPWATSSFGKHANLAAVSTASQIIRAISKPFIGKLADITSRPTTYTVVLVFYVVGFVVAASAQTFAAYTVGMAFTAAGKSGLDLLSDIIVGDLTVLEWRGFFGAVLSVPFLVTVPINGFITEGLEDNWRWGMGMFAIMVPVLLLPAIATLYVMQFRGKKLGMVTMAGSKNERTGVDGQSRTWWQSLKQGVIEIDLFGLVLLGFGFSMLLLPFTLRKAAVGGWKNPSMIAMLVTGPVILGLFLLWEMKFAPKPLMTRKILFNRAVIASIIVSSLSQLASSVRNTYFYSYISVITPWSTYTQTIFVGITTMGLCLVGPIVGLIQRRTHRYKSLMVFGNSCRIIAYGILVVGGSNEMTRSTARLTVAQLMFCLSSFSVVGVRVGSQASVPHEDMASVIAIISLWSTLGSSIGGAIAAAIWTDMMPDELARQLPDVAAATRTKLYGSITAITKYSFDDPVRQGCIRAYAVVNGHIAITALCLATIPLIATFYMPNFYLGKQQNAVTGTGLDGEKVAVDDGNRTEAEVLPAGEESAPKGQQKLIQRLRVLYQK